MDFKRMGMLTLVTLHIEGIKLDTWGDAIKVKSIR